MDSSGRVGYFVDLLKSDEAIKIFVGDITQHPQPYCVPKTLLLLASDYFDKALQPGFKEGQERELCFPQDDVAAWRLILYYMFYGKVDSPGLKIEYEALFEAYKLGEKYLMTAFKDHIFSIFRHDLIYDFALPSELRIQIINTRPSDCPLRLLVISHVARYLIKPTRDLQKIEWALENRTRSMGEVLEGFTEIAAGKRGV